MNPLPLFCSRFIFTAILACLVAGIFATKANADKPNVIIIFADDQGYNDLGCFGSPRIKTPNIDQMAAEGRKYTSFYTACSVCSPSRTALLTGCYPKRVGMHRHVLFPTSNYGLNPSEYTIADHLKSQGMRRHVSANGIWGTTQKHCREPTVLTRTWVSLTRMT